MEYFQSFLGYVTMPVVVVLLGGLFWPRAGAAAAFWTLVVAAPLGLLGFFAGEIFELHTLHFLYATGVMLVISLLMFIAIALANEAPAEDKTDEYTWTRETWKKETRELEGKPFYKNYRYLCMGLGIVTVAVVIPFI